MAYKDEYEVARLQLDPRFRAQVEREFGKGATAAVLLHPPILRALGVKSKIAFGPGTLWMLGVLYRLRRLRGTAFDIFGYTEVRKVERRLIREYTADVRWMLPLLTPDTHALAVEIARLPDLVRGYEEIKLDNVGLYRARRAELVARFESATGSKAPA